MSWWRNTYRLAQRTYACAYCETSVSSREGFWNDYWNCCIYLCPSCDQPTYFGLDGSQVPHPLFGDEIQHLPADVREAYQEIRRCLSASVFTAAFLLSHWLLLRLSEDSAARAGQTRASSLDLLLSNVYLPDTARRRLERLGNIDLSGDLPSGTVNRNDAIDLYWLLVILLRYVYELPGRISGAA